MSVERPVVLVDMDSVLADFDGALETGIQLIYPAFIPPDRTLDFYMHKRTDDRVAIKHYGVIKNAEGFFRSLPVIDGALEGWGQIEELGYHPQVCTAPLHTNLYCKAEKLAWLDQHLGAHVADEAILDANKWAHDGITLIDDRPVVSGYEKASWIHTVYTQPYNKIIETEFRLNDWFDPNLSRLLARCATRYEQLR